MRRRQIREVYRRERQEIAQETGWSPERIRKMRQKLGYNLRQFGVLIGVTESMVFHWEKGDKTPSWSKEIRLQICYEKYILPVILEEQAMAMRKLEVDAENERFPN